jgi:hypothetical protein
MSSQDACALDLHSRLVLDHSVADSSLVASTAPSAQATARRLPLLLLLLRQLRRRPFLLLLRRRLLSAFCSL